MSFVRRHLRRGVAVWLMCHALAFTALVPRDCCAAHRHGAPSHDEASAATDAPPCHETAAAPELPAGAHCEMAAADGAACPMHQAQETPQRGCAISGSCQVPAASLAAVLLQSAVLVPAFDVVPPVAPQLDRRPPDVSARSLAIPPDNPPPRA